VARPKTYTDDTKLRLNPNGTTKLQQASDRRAIVNLLVEHGGTLTLKEIDDHFGFDIRNKALALVRAGWLTVVES
jgi:hypothetical protein